MKIKVIDHDVRQYITVQFLDEDGALDECNHAGAEEQDEESVAYGSNAYGEMNFPDDSITLRRMVCDKLNCRAWQDETGQWQRG